MRNEELRGAQRVDLSIILPILPATYYRLPTQAQGVC